jgi:hypothetical protein
MTNPLWISGLSVDVKLVSRLMSLSVSWKQTHTILGIEFSISNTRGFGSESSTSALMPVPRIKAKSALHFWS